MWRIGIDMQGLFERPGYFLFLTSKFILLSLPEK
jgi:hypothetical protein